MSADPPAAVRRIVPGSFAALAALARAPDWTASKLPFLAGMTLLTVQGPVRFSVFAAAVAIVSGLATFGFAVNDIADRRYDALAGKRNRASALSGAQRAVVLGGAATVALGAALAETPGPLGPLLVTANLAIAAAYSLPPFRLKERDLLGVAAAAVSQWCFPVLVLAASVGPGLSVPAVWVIAGLGLAVGVRWIAIHQAQDIAADRRAGTVTFATRGGSVRLVIAGALVVECALLAAVLALAWPSSRAALLALALWVCIALLTLRERPPLAQCMLTYAHAPLADYYFLMLPVALAFARMSPMAGAVVAALIFAAFGRGQAMKLWGEMADAIGAPRHK